MALALLAIGTKAAALALPPCFFQLTGPPARQGAGRPPTPASGFAQLLPKASKWLTSIFGCRDAGKSRVADLLLRSNAEGKSLDQPVSFALRADTLLPTHLRIYLEKLDDGRMTEHPVATYEECASLYALMERQWAAHEPRYTPVGLTPHLRERAYDPEGCAGRTHPSSSATRPNSAPDNPMPLSEMVEAILNPDHRLRFAVTYLDTVAPKWIGQSSVDPLRLGEAALSLANLGSVLAEDGEFRTGSRFHLTAARLWTAHGSGDRALDCATKALSHARPGGANQEVCEILLQHRRILLRPWALSPPLIAEFIGMLGAALSDYGEFSEAITLIGHSNRILGKCVGTSLLDKTGRKEALTRIRLNKVALGHLCGLSAPTEALYLLEAAIQEQAESRLNGRATGVGIFAQCRFYLQHGHHRKCFEMLSEHEDQILQCSPWGQVTYYSTMAFLLDHLDRRKDAVIALDRAALRMKSLGIRPTLDPTVPRELLRPFLLMGKAGQLANGVGLVLDRNTKPTFRSLVGDLVKMALDRLPSELKP